MRQHHAEAGLEQEAIPLDPDWDRLFSYDRAGIVHLTTARSDDILVGYAFSIAAFPIWHAGTKAAHLEILYLDPVYREGWAGYRLLKQHFEELRQAGVRVIKAETPERVADGRLRILLKRLGMKEIERVFYKMVEL